MKLDDPQSFTGIGFRDHDENLNWKWRHLGEYPVVVKTKNENFILKHQIEQDLEWIESCYVRVFTGYMLDIV